MTYLILAKEIILVPHTSGCAEFKIPGSSRSNAAVEVARHEAVSVSPSDILSRWEEDNLLREYLNCFIFMVKNELLTYF